MFHPILILFVFCCILSLLFLDDFFKQEEIRVWICMGREMRRNRGRGNHIQNILSEKNLFSIKERIKQSNKGPQTFYGPFISVVEVNTLSEVGTILYHMSAFYLLCDI